MVNVPRNFRGNREGNDDGSLDLGGARQPRAISLEQAARIAGEVQELVRAEREHSAWELIRYLHPADVGSIVASLPGASREAMVRVMSPETFTWMLRQMNPVEAGRIGTRLGARMLTFVLRQVHPSQALATLRRIRIGPNREVAESLEQPSLAEEFLAYEPDTAGSLMVVQLPTADIDGLAEAARESLGALSEIRDKLTHVYVVMDGDKLVGQISVVDLALADNATPIREIASSPVAAVTVDTSAEECARLRRHYNLTQLPVVDGDRLTGAVLAEALLSATVEHDTRQMQEVGNVAGETVDGPLVSSVRTRLPWLTINLATTFLAAAVVALFEPTADSGGRSRRIPARGRGAGRDWRDADAYSHRSRNRAWRTRWHKHPATPGSGSLSRPAARGLAGHSGCGHRHRLEAEPGSGLSAWGFDARQYANRGFGRSGGASAPATNRVGPGGGVGGGRYDDYGRVRIPAVSGHCDRSYQSDHVGRSRRLVM